MIVICCVIVDGFTLEPIDFVEVKDKDGVRSYPVLKVSFRDHKRAKKNIKNKSELKDEISANSEQVDNVREFQPMSREDIRMLKKVTFHGRSSPTTASNKNRTRSNTTRTSAKQRQANNNARQSSLPVQVNPRERHYRQQQSSNERKNPRKKEISSKSFTTSVEDKGFQPLMRPSPINLHPHNRPSFDTIRNYVDYLKMRQKTFFSDLDEPKVASESKNTEVEYFVNRERELAEEAKPRMIKSVGGDPDEPHDINIPIDEIEGRDIDSNEGGETDEEESRRHEHFVPFRMYAQVRHVEAENHEPKYNAPEPRVTQKLTLEKKNVYYKEEGYHEQDYDHGDEKSSSRSKREVKSNEEAPEALPIILYHGEKVLKQLSELLSKSSFFLPDEDDAIEYDKKKRPVETIYGTSKVLKSHKYPYYNLPDTNTLNTMSAFRYSENMKNFPSAKQSLYDFKNAVDCEEIDREVNPVPDDIEEEGKSTKYNKNPQRLKKLGDKIGCFKRKYFGKDPFDNPLFKEKYVSAPNQHISLNNSSLIAHQANPLITVYDDVISNIRAAFADELLMQQKARALEKENLSTQIPADTLPASTTINKSVGTEIKRGSNAAAVSRLPLFDINKFYPKLTGKKEETTTHRPIKRDFEMEYIEIPISEQNIKTVAITPLQIGSIVIKNLRPPNLAQEKRRRRNPTIPRNSPPSHFLQPPSTTTERIKFKLL